MWTGVYWPKDGLIAADGKVSYGWSKGDHTTQRNNAACLEGPSYCVRLIVFETDDTSDSNFVGVPND